MYYVGGIRTTSNGLSFGTVQFCCWTRTRCNWVCDQYREGMHMVREIRPDTLEADTVVVDSVVR